MNEYLQPFASIMNEFFKSLSDCGLLSSYTVELQSDIILPESGRVLRTVIEDLISNLQNLLTNFPKEEPPDTPTQTLENATEIPVSDHSDLSEHHDWVLSAQATSNILEDTEPENEENVEIIMPEDFTNLSVIKSEMDENSESSALNTFKTELLFSIVKFTDEQTTAIVPTSWFDEENNCCKYPSPRARLKVDKWVRDERIAEEKWPSYSAVVIKKYRTYEAARFDLQSSMETSNLGSKENDEYSKKKKIINSKVFYSGDEVKSDKESTTNSPGCTTPFLTTFNNSNSPQAVSSPNSQTNSSSCNTTNTMLNQRIPLLKLTKISISNVRSLSELSTSQLTPQHSTTPTHQQFNQQEQPSSADFTPSYNTNLHKNLEPNIQPRPISQTDNYDSDQSSTVFSQRPQISTTINSSARQIPNGEIWQGIMELQSTIVDVFNMVKDLDNKMDIVTQRQDIFCSETDGEEDGKQCELFGLMPLSTVDDFYTLNNELKENKSLQTKIVKKFTAFGGRSEKHLCYNIMRRLLTDKLATQFSYTGKKWMREGNTISFGGTELCKRVHASVMKKFQNTTEEATKKAIMGFLNQAKTRLTRREQGTTTGEK